jgi:Predicted GTPases
MIDTGNGQGQAVIHYILPRKSVFVRRESGKRNREQIVAANIDTVFICMSLNNDFNLRRLERYLSAAWNSGSIPVVVLTKADLCANVCEKISQIESVAIGVDILVTSALKDEGYNQLLPYIKEGKTVAFIGSSGVGKSTLVKWNSGRRRIGNQWLKK